MALSIFETILISLVSAINLVSRKATALHPELGPTGGNTATTALPVLELFAECHRCLTSRSYGTGFGHMVTRLAWPKIHLAKKV